jgi:hypothetical protein
MQRAHERDATVKSGNLSDISVPAFDYSVPVNLHHVQADAAPQCNMRETVIK